MTTKTPTTPVLIVRVDGTEEPHDLPDDGNLFRAIEALIGADDLDHVTLETDGRGGGRVMFVNDRGYDSTFAVVDNGGPVIGSFVPVRALLPVNAKATAIVAAARGPQRYPIVGDVAIVTDRGDDR